MNTAERRPVGPGRARVTATRIAMSSLLIAVMLTGTHQTRALGAGPAFVARDGRELTLDGQPFRFTGVNIYAANSDGWCGEHYDANQLRTAFDGIGSRDTVLRAWFFQTLAAQKGPDGAWTGVRDWTRFDQTLAIAAEKGVHVIVTLTDQWGECGDGGHSGFKDKDWYLGGYNSPDPILAARYDHWVSYRDWVTEVVNRYKDDSTILAWQLVNEAEVKDSLNAGCPVGDPGNPLDHGHILREFARDISDLVRSIDANHLISLGTIGGGQCGTDAWQYPLIHDLPNIDLCEVHDYSLEAMPGVPWNGLQLRLDQCAGLDKPVFIGESGITPDNLPLADQSLEGRARLYDAKFRAQFGAGVVGELVWDYRRTGSTLNTYDIGDGDPTLDRLRAWSAGCTWRPAETPPVSCGPRRDDRLDPSFGHNGKAVTFSGSPSLSDAFQTVLVQPDGKIVAGGSRYINAQDRMLVRFNPDGTLDPSFGATGRRIDSFTNAGDFVDDLAIQSDGKIVAVGHIERTISSRGVDFGITRHNADGSLDASFGDGGVVFEDFTQDANHIAMDYAMSVVIYADGRILVGGYALEPERLEMARYLPDGSLDPSFGSGGKVVSLTPAGRLLKLILEPDGRINVVTSSGNMTVGRFLANGQLDTSFGTNGSIELPIQGLGYNGGAARAADGSLVISGFIQYDINNDLGAYAVSRVLPNGTLDTAFGNGGRTITQIGSVNDIPFDLAIQADGKILQVGIGDSGTVQTVDFDIGLVRYNVDGSLDPTFGGDGIIVTDLGGSNETAYGMALQMDGRLVVVGQSSNQSGVGSGFVTRYLAGPPAAAPTVPTVPTNVTAVAGNGQAVVTWDAILDGGSPITGFTLTASPSGAETTFATGPSGTVTGLTNGTPYTFTVTATNAVGSSVASGPSSPVTPVEASPPDAPSNVDAVVGDGEVTLTWDAPADNGLPITGYSVSTTNVAGPPLPYPIVSTTATSATIGGLANGEGYDFAVTASNAFGSGPGSTAVLASPTGPRNAPSAPRFVFAAATGDADGACVTWDAPLEYGGGLQGFLIRAANGEMASIGATGYFRACFSGTIPNGIAQEFRVAALGGPNPGTPRYGPWSAPSNPVTPPHSPPTPPKRLFAYREDGSATVEVQLPDFNGGGTVSMLTVTSSPGGHTASSPILSSSTNIRLTGLTNGVAYTYTATATNEYGTSVPSAPSEPVTPGGLPGAPLAVTASAGDGSAAISWTAPTSNGGRPLEYYRVVAQPGGAERYVSPEATTTTLSGLLNGTEYRFTVHAVNFFGEGPASAPSNPVTPTPPVSPPGAPGNVAAAAGDGSAVVTWTAPASDGGSPLTTYTVTASPGGATLGVGGGVTSTSVTGLTNGTAYTFRVTASNAAGPGTPSDPTPEVTPQSGAPPPQAVSGPIDDSGGQVSTDPGTGPTGSDPVTTSVIVPAGAGAGTVSVAETAISVTPPTGGYQFVGQQVDITSDLATSAANPLMIVLTIDESVLRAAYALASTDPLPDPTAVDVTRAEGGGGTAIVAACTNAIGSPITPDPCVRERLYIGTDLRVTIVTSSASHWNAAVRPTIVTVSDTGYAPKVVTIAQGGVVRWTFGGSRRHSVTDSQKLGPSIKPLYDSGLKLPGGSFGYSFLAAGTYAYGSTASGDGKLVGTVAVPITVSPLTGTPGTTFTINWATRSMPGFVFDIEWRYQKPNAKSWSAWATFQSGTTVTRETTLPPSGSGTYAIRARLRNAATSKVSGWSPDYLIVVRN